MRNLFEGLEWRVMFSAEPVSFIVVAPPFSGAQAETQSVRLTTTVETPHAADAFASQADLVELNNASVGTATELVLAALPPVSSAFL